MRACILTIGDELLEGKLDTNSAWISLALDRIGFRVLEIRHCRDNVDDIARSLEELSERAPLVITTGGLGPTTDDLTTEAVARWAGRPTTVHEPTWTRIQARFRERGFDLPPENIKQAHFPAGSMPILNPVGSAVGYLAEREGRLVATFPGVPREMMAMVEQTLLPLLTERFPRASFRAIRELRIFGHTESGVNQLLKGIADGIAGVEIAYLVSFPEVRVFFKVEREEAAAAEQAAEDLAREAARRLGDRVYGFGENSLQAAVGELLGRTGLKLALAESCTGGMIGSQITAVAGSSAWFLEGFVTYSNDAKIRRLGVSHETLREHGAVSAETCEEMLQGALEKSGADVAIAVTGIAGPGGGTEERPVGLVYIGWGDRDGAEVREFRFGPLGRDEVRRLTAATALDRLRRWLLARAGGQG